MGDWYYIGHYGQLGPLTREQMDELVQGGVVGRDTYVWRQGMTDWIPAASCPEFVASFRAGESMTAPPPPPEPQLSPTAPPSVHGAGFSIAPTASYYPTFGGLRSDRSRIAAGVLQLFLPGIGRMYLGYLAYGALQLLLTIATCGILSLWSFIDGIIILTGGVKLDGYGRHLSD